MNKSILCAVAVLASLASAQQVIREDVMERLPRPVAGAQPTVMVFSRMGGDGVKNAPYSADTITETTQVLADGNRIVRSNKSSFARDGQGRTRHQTQIQHLGPLGQTEQPLVSVFISDPVAKTAYQLDARAKTVTRTPLTPGPGNARELNIRVPAPGVEPAAGVTSIVRTEVRMHTIDDGRGIAGAHANGRNVKAEDLGEKSFEGVMARGQRTTLTIPPGEAGNEKALEIVTEHWHSAAIKAPVYTRHYDPRFGETITRLANVQLGEPSAHLFEVPADYQEAKAEPAFVAPRRVIVREEE